MKLSIKYGKQESLKIHQLTKKFLKPIQKTFLEFLRRFFYNNIGFKFHD